MSTDKAFFFKVLALVILVCGCVATKTSKKGKKSTEEALRQSATCPPRMGEEEFCQIFTQEGGGGSRPIDILWVIDNSGSMNDDQKRLGDNFETFINQFAGQNQNTDFKMMITSGGPGDTQDYFFGLIPQGKYLDHSLLKADKKGFVDAFKNAVQLPNNSNRTCDTECGLSANLEYLKNYASVFRSDAYLIAIYVSDEDDQSVALPGVFSTTDDVMADAYFKAISGLKASPQLFKAFAIVKTSSSTQSSNVNYGGRYIKTAQLSGGKAYDIINDSFSTIFQDFGSELAKIASQFQLKYPVQMGTVEVYIDGVIAPQGDWNYLQNQNAIRFKTGLFANKEGKSTIKVTYQTQ